MRKIAYILLALFLTICMFSGCSDNKNPLPSNSHPENWKEATGSESHRLKLQQAGSEGLKSCVSCHGEDFTGGESGVSCFQTQCHASDHNTAGWNEKSDSLAFHGTYLRKEQYNYQKCIDCHAKNLAGNEKSFISACDKCHTNYPHTYPNWKNGVDSLSHAVYIRNQGGDLSSCQLCHGNDFQGGGGKSSCNKCHNSYPHVAGWAEAKNPNNHGLFLSHNNWKVEDCAQCHGADYQGGDGNSSCYSCHNSYPHDKATWSDEHNPNYHGKKIKNGELRLEDCQACHGMDYKGGISQKTCYQCHSSYPHVEGWEELNNPNNHGLFLSHNNWKVEDCAQCHGADYKGGDGNASCYSCHDSYPHDSQVWTNVANSNYHGAFLKNNGFDLNKCAVCHGADFTGGNSQSSCFKCHASYPHADSWTNPLETKSHIAYLRSHQHNLKDCQACHGNDYKGGDTGSGCFACHTSPVGPEACDLCHGGEENFAPPKDTHGNTTESFMGVGRHQLHVADRSYTCELCHQIPAVFSADGHVYKDNTPDQAEVLPFWKWNRDSGTCVSSCHNDADKNYIWNH